MKENNLNFFVDSILNYFKQTTGKEAVVGIPYLKEEEAVVLDFTGIIGISGKQKGSIYLTATHKMLEELGTIILADIDYGQEELKDLVGEIANTIAGNVRDVYGSSFLISVPAVVVGRPHDIRFPEELPVFVIPIKWQKYQAFLVVCLEDK